jgi:hypothetical protein
LLWKPALRNLLNAIAEIWDARAGAGELVVSLTPAWSGRPRACVRGRKAMRTWMFEVLRAIHDRRGWREIPQVFFRERG